MAATEQQVEMQPYRRFSLAELDRRWKAIRELMARDHLDALVAPPNLGNSTDWQADARYISHCGGGADASIGVVFPLEGDVTVVATSATTKILMFNQNASSSGPADLPMTVQSKNVLPSRLLHFLARTAASQLESPVRSVAARASSVPPSDCPDLRLCRVFPGWPRARRASADAPEGRVGSPGRSSPRTMSGWFDAQ